MTPQITAILSALFLLAGGASLGIMMAKLGGREFANPERAVRAHRALGWVFTALYFVLLVVMVGRIEEYWEAAPARIAIHATLAMALFVLLALKVSIPRLFPGLARHLFPLGAAVYLTGFVLVSITAGYYAVWRSMGAPYVSHRVPAIHMFDPRLGMELFITKCSTCHLLRDVMTPRTPAEWEAVVNRMVRLSAPRIKPGEASQILQYLSQTHVPRKAAPKADASLIERHCAPCHDPREIARRPFSRKEWEQVVRRMTEHDPETVPRSETAAIVEALLRAAEE